MKQYWDLLARLASYGTLYHRHRITGSDQNLGVPRASAGSGYPLHLLARKLAVGIPLLSLTQAAFRRQEPEPKGSVGFSPQPFIALASWTESRVDFVARFAASPLTPINVAQNGLGMRWKGGIWQWPWGPRYRRAVDFPEGSIFRVTSQFFASDVCCVWRASRAPCL